jgi:hypothetical protein
MLVKWLAAWTWHLWTMWVYCTTLCLRWRHDINQNNIYYYDILYKNLWKMTNCKIKFSYMPFGNMTFSYMTLSYLTLSYLTLSYMAFSNLALIKLHSTEVFQKTTWSRMTSNRKTIDWMAFVKMTPDRMACELTFNKTEPLTPTRHHSQGFFLSFILPSSFCSVSLCKAPFCWVPFHLVSFVKMTPGRMECKVKQWTERP